MLFIIIIINIVVIVKNIDKISKSYLFNLTFGYINKLLSDILISL